jgi:hypothetical protein
MAVVIQGQGEGVGPEQYDALLEAVDWENRPATGGIFHIAWFDEQGLRFVDVWESEEAWQTFAHERLMPAFESLGVTEPPPYTAAPVHRYFNTESAHRAVPA